MAFSKTLKEKRLLVQCDTCFRDVTTIPFIRYANNIFDQCLACFLDDEKNDSHLSGQHFRLVSNLFSPLFGEEWRVIDELLLVNGIISFGIGNFEDISTVLSTHDESSVKKHFYTLVDVLDNPTGEEPLHEPQEGSVLLKSDPNDTRVLSYMPERREFESEIHNDYEALIEDLSLEGVGDSLEGRFKRYMLYHYRTVLKQRAQWRNMLIDRNLVAVSEIKKHDGTSIGSLANKWRWLLKFLSKNDFNRFIDGLLYEKMQRDQLGRSNDGRCVDESSLRDISDLLSSKEKKLCQLLNMSHRLYVRLKRFSIECFIARRPLHKAMFRFFDEEFHERLEVLYRWFLKQKIVYREDLK